MNMIRTSRSGSAQSSVSVVQSSRARLSLANRHQSWGAAAAYAAPCRKCRESLRRASGLLLLVLSAACSSVSSYMSTSVHEGAVQNCIKKICGGATEAKDYQSCEATCRERFGP
jgi:hypothetical protein